MTKKHLLVALLACVVSTAQAEYPAIDEFEGFEVDMEPMWINFEQVENDPTPLDVEGYFRTEMQSMLPNVMGVILQRYDKTKGNTTHAFFTGMAVFQGPPFRTNHEVFTAQTSALTSLQAAASYLHVHNASLGIPSWFDATLLGDHNVHIDEQTDGPVAFLQDSSDKAFSWGSMVVGMAVGFVIGALVASVALLYMRSSSRRVGTGARGSPRHKRKVSNDISLQDIDIDDDASSGNEQFHDEEDPAPHSPKRDEDEDIKSTTPLKRRPSHHRRWKSSAFHDMQSPSSVLDGFPGIDSASSNHRRSNSVAGPTGRRPSMVDLLADDIAELMNDFDPAEEFNDD